MNITRLRSAVILWKRDYGILPMFSNYASTHKQRRKHRKFKRKMNDYVNKHWKDYCDHVSYLPQQNELLYREAYYIIHAKANRAWKGYIWQWF